jgi:hypothetical protein
VISLENYGLSVPGLKNRMHADDTSYGCTFYYQYCPYIHDIHDGKRVSMM